MGDPYAAELLVEAPVRQARRGAPVGPGARQGGREQAALPGRVAKAARRVPAVTVARVGLCAAVMVERRQGEVRLGVPPAGPEAGLSRAGLRAMARAMSVARLVGPAPEPATEGAVRRGDVIPGRTPASSGRVAIGAIARRHVVWRLR